MGRIDYRFRPKKAAERVMLCRALQRVGILESLNKYQYIGFGALFFVDFKLFHKELGIHKMISIEKDNQQNNRYLYNLPYSFVNFKQGESHNILPKLDLSILSLVWLDYTSKLTKNALFDIATCTSELPYYSIVFVTLNHRASRYSKTTHPSEDDIFRGMESELGAERLGGVSSNEMCTNSMPNVYRRILKNEIEKTIKQRNFSDQPKMTYVELCAFQYNDDTQMVTFGVMLVPDGKKTVVRNSFKGLPYMMTKDFYHIDFPLMTMKEQLLCLTDKRQLKRKRIFTPEEIKLFEKHYKYIPFYTESVLY